MPAPPWKDRLGPDIEDETIGKSCRIQQKKETGTPRSPDGAGDRGGRLVVTAKSYFLRRLEAFFLAAFLRRAFCFFNRPISLCCLRIFALALLASRLAVALAFFNVAAAPPEAFFLRFAI